MSVTVTAVPVVLFSTLEVVFSGLTLGAVALKGAIDVAKGISNTNSYKNDYIHLEQKDLQELLSKEFKTTIMDKDTLIKTLEEHGATNIQDKNGTVLCTCEAFHLVFAKNEDDAPYSMTATFNDEYGLDTLVSDLGTEYAVNAQEVSYNKIKERLESQNLEITEEEIYDDNTIVLTIDLED